MFRLSRPTPAQVEAFLTEQRGERLTYAQGGATHPAAEEGAMGRLPAGFRVIRKRRPVGRGRTTFLAMREVVRRWGLFELSWLEMHRPATPLREGEVMVLLAHAYGGWAMNASRILYVLDQEGPPARFGFAYGTLPGHAIVGEERLMVEWDPADDRVWYDILAFSRPSPWLNRLGPVPLRSFQDRFAAESYQALLRGAGKQGGEREMGP